MDIVDVLEQAVKVAKERLETLEEELQAARTESQANKEAACEALGGHIDDGGFMYGSCTRCGKWLG